MINSCLLFGELVCHKQQTLKRVCATTKEAPTKCKGDDCGGTGNASQTGWEWKLKEMVVW